MRKRKEKMMMKRKKKKQQQCVDFGGFIVELDSGLVVPKGCQMFSACAE